MLGKFLLVELAFVQDVGFLFEGWNEFILEHRHVGTILQGVHNEFIKRIQIGEEMLALDFKWQRSIGADTVFTAIREEFNLGGGEKWRKIYLFLFKGFFF